MKPARDLIVNADDFGRSRGINRGILRAHRVGIVTSASLMVRWPAAEEAAALAAGSPDLGVGLHLDLCEWVFRSGAWEPVYEVVPSDDPTAVRDEVERQLDAFHGLVGRAPSHLDSHQHVHRNEPLASILAGASQRLGIPLRDHGSRVRYCGDFFGQSRDGLPLPELVSADHLLRILEALPPGVTELACHPGEGDDAASSYGAEREREVAALCDPRVRAAVAAEGIRLRSFRDLSREGRAPDPSAAR